MPADPKKVKKLEADIKDREGRIVSTQQLTKKWNKLEGPVSPADERILASGAHGVHGKVKYDQAVQTLEKNITQAKAEVEKLKKELATEKAKK